VEADPTTLRLTVVDRGPGIPDSAKEAVFDLFHQLGTRGTGVGVGLFLVRRFAVLHGGGARVTDAPGGGTSFQVQLAL
jgi:two-component system sensor histidine kinase KdpD